MVKHKDYWAKRVEDIFRHVDRTDLDIFAELSKIYSDEATAIQKELYAFFEKYAEEHQITLSEARQRIFREDLSDYRQNAETYRRSAEKDPELLKRLNEQYVSSRVTRLDALNMDLTYRVGMLQSVLQDSFEKYLSKTASYGYKKALDGRIRTLNEPALKELIYTPFDGKNFSQDLWGHTDNLAKDLRNALKKGFVRGDHPRVMARELAKKYNVARSRAETLVRTEGTSIINRSAARRYEDAGLKYYRDLVHLDDRTTEICQEVARKNERKLISEMKPGINAAPYHFNCRTGIIPDEEELNGNSKVEPFKADSLDSADSFFKNQESYQKWYNGLSKQEKKAIGNYTTSSHMTMNNIMRQGVEDYRRSYLREARTNEDLKYYSQYFDESIRDIKTIENAIKGFKIEKPFVTYRAISFWGKDDFANISVGDKVVLDKSFASSSLISKVADDFIEESGADYKFIISVPEGYSGGSYISELSDMPMEKEFLFSPGAKIEVVSIKNINGIKYIKAEALK